MAFANPCLQKEWEEWREAMEEMRRQRWREMVQRWSEVRLSDDEEENEDKEEDNIYWDEDDEDQSEAEESDTDWKEEDASVDEVEDEEMRDEEGGNGMSPEVKKMRKEEGQEQVVGSRVNLEGEEEEVVENKKMEMAEAGEEGEADMSEKEVREIKTEDEEDSDMEEGMYVEKDLEEGEERDENEFEVDERVIRADEVEKLEDREGDELEKEVEESNMEDYEDGDMEGDSLEEEFEEEDREEKREVMEVKKLEDTAERELKVNGVDEEEGETGGVGKDETEAEKEVGIENGEVDEEEENGLTETEAEQEREGEGEVEEVREQEKRAEEGGNELEVIMNGEVSGEEDWQFRGEAQVEDVEEDEEEYQEQEQVEQFHLLHQFQDQCGRIDDPDLQRNQEATMQESRRVNEGPNLSGSGYEKSELLESDEECYTYKTLSYEGRNVSKSYEEPEELQVPGGTEVPWTSKDRREVKDTTGKLGNKGLEVSESTQDEGFQDVPAEQEDVDESTEDEDAEDSTEEEPDDYEKDMVKIYHTGDYLVDVFRTLTEFRYSYLLTDLTLCTGDGTSFHVHSLVMAAVSSLIRDSLSRRNMETADTSVGLSKWSLSLGPEVDHVGLEAIVEFAYTGHISFLRADNLHQIKAAAQSLGTQRVLDLCKVEEERSTKTEEEKKEKRDKGAEQLLTSLKSIKQLWMDRIGCDVILEAVGGSLHVHRVILAVGSDYFRSMFTLGMKESYQPRVALPFLLASELEVLIGCSYSGALPLSWKSIFEITSTALQLQYQPALSLCLHFLHHEINPHSCLDVVSFAKAYEMEQLLEVADDYVLRQFQRVACTSKFKDLPANQLLRYLTSHSLCVPSELVVFKAVVAWIEAKPKKRLKLAKELMKTIHFPLMTFKEFREVQSLKMWSDYSLAELFEAVVEEFWSNDVAPQTQWRIYLPKESLVLIGGDQTSEDLCSRSISRELWFGNSLRNHTGIRKAMEWRKLGELPEPARFRHEVTVFNGQLYVFGGKSYYGIGDTLNTVCRYDPLQNTWESLADMQKRRSAFSVVVLDGKILAIGGHCDHDYQESVEQYCPSANSWRFTCPLDLPLSGHVAKVLHGQIYVSGGLNIDYQCVSSMFLYHPDTGSTYLANMARPRAYHCMETLGDYIYVAGGLTTDKNMIINDDLTCEVYNPAADTWTAFASLPVPHVGAGSSVLEGKFYVLGGYSQVDCSDTKLVHRYDPSTQRWENMGKMPGPNNDIRAALLCLPQHFRL
ncbi:uncharacterized protein LOC121504866 [Xyrichtys novacula]|uniref:Uncharacterized protein LOC121504866 n=1 Tax=Xyrichtys novacula TaxID=13765 RepID=A0AAV1HM98_XYRNO|nr:uncharacterized protein LOC121504866 [Xyrichtys novacula]